MKEEDSVQCEKVSLLFHSVAHKVASNVFYCVCSHPVSDKMGNGSQTRVKINSWWASWAERPDAGPKRTTLLAD